MGAFLKSIENQNHQKPEYLDFFANNSYTKLNEYYSLFKSISQTYEIDNDQFDQLFGHSYPQHKQLFECLDDDHNLLIDGLELFTGLALLSMNIQFKEKIMFVFQMFDLNDLKSLCRTDIEFMVMTACNIVAKIYRIDHQEISVEDFIKQEFEKRDDRVNISEILRWASRSSAVEKFFELINFPYQKDDGTIISRRIYLTLPNNMIPSKSVTERVYSEQQTFIANTSKLFKPLQQKEEEQLYPKIHEIIPQTSWVYGIRFKDTKQFIEMEGKEIIYYVGKVVILYNRMSRKQRHYLGHKQEIISIAKSKDVLMATAEYGPHPQIKVWNRKTLETVISLKGHSKGVHLLSFINDLLVSCGCSHQSPILIHSLETGHIVFSTYTQWPAVDLCQAQNFTNQSCQQFVVGSLYGIDHFKLENIGDKTSIKVTKLRDTKINNVKLTCICFFMINATFQQLKEYDEKVEKCLLAGYQNGQIVLWNLNKCERQLVFSNEGYEILGIIPTHNFLYVITNSTFIVSYDIAVQQRQKITTINFTQINQEVTSYDLVNFKHTNLGLLLITSSADLVLLNPQEPIIKSSLSFKQNQFYPATKIPDVLYFAEGITAQKIIKKDDENTLFICQGHRVKGIDMEKHSFIRQWNVGQKITAFDVIVVRNLTWLIVVGVKISEERSYLISQADFSQSNSREQLPGEIKSICLHSEQHSSSVIVLVSTRDAIYKYNYSKNNFMKSTSLSLEDHYPRLTLLDSNKFLISNKKNTFQMIVANKQTHNHTQSLVDRSIVSDSPIKIHFWVGGMHQSLVNVVGRRVKCLVVTRINGNIDIFNNYKDLSNCKPMTLMGHNSWIADICITHDQKKLLSCGKHDGMIIEWNLRVSGQKKSAVRSMNISKNKQSTKQREDPIKLQFCRFNNSILNDCYDQHLKMTGIKNENIRRLFRASLNDWKTNSHSQQPNLNLELTYAFGMQTTHKNQTLIVLQSKKIMYFIGKIIVIFHIESNSQRFYRGHKFRVTCFSLLPDKNRVASGQASYHPIINVWSTHTLQTLLIIQTDHIGGIIDLAVQGNIILSFGFRQKTIEEQQTKQYLYSFQVFDYEHNQSLAYRHEKDYCYAIAIDPINNLKFATCNEGSISFWEVSANRIIRRSICSIDQDTPTACLYYTGSQGSKKEPDLLVGTLSGAIGVVSRQRHWWVFKRGEKQSKQINCLLVVYREQQNLILASSDDSLLRCWNSSFDQKFRYDLLKDDQSQERKGNQNRLKEEYNRSLQSLCLVDPQKLRIMGATRNCQILSLQIKAAEKGTDTIENSINKFSGGFSEKGKGKVLISHHPRFDVLATLGQDHIVMFWNCEQNTILHSRQLGLDIEKTWPTALKFSQNGDYLIAGFSDGLLLYLDSKMSKSMQGKGGDSKYSQPSLNPITKEKAEDNFAVVGIQFSQGGEYLAVSYHYLQPHRSIATIKVFASKAKNEKLYRPNKLQYQKMYDLHCVIDNHNLQRAFDTVSGRWCGYAACSMSFAEHQGGHYLLMFFDVLDQNQSRIWINQSEEGTRFKLLHINNKTDSFNFDQLLKWRKPPIHRALTANYLFQARLNQNLPANNHLRIPQFTNSVILDRYLLTASQNGDLHLLKAGTIEHATSIAKTLPAHGCIVNQIEYNHDRTYIYTTGQNDNCVLKWRVQGIASINYEEQGEQTSLDIFGQIPEPQQLETRLQRYDEKFKTIGVGASIPGFIQQVKVRQIIGRSSQYQRNNIKTDSKGRILYYSGQALIASNLQSRTKQFLYLTDQRKIVEQISAIEISQHDDIVAVAYCGRKAEIVLWALSSKIIQSRIYLDDIVQVIYMTFSYDHSRLLLYGLRGTKAEGCLVLIDLINLNILATATYIHKQSWHLKGLTFLPMSCDRFYSCGVQPVKEWYYHSGQIVYSILNPKFQSQNSIIHTSLAFANQTLITGTDTGQLIVWHQTPQSYAGHPQMITCLSVSKQIKNSIYVVSGSQARLDSQNFQIILWSYSDGTLQELRKISANCDKFDEQLLGSRVNSNFEAGLEVQSLAFWQNQIYIGLLKGDIFSYDCSRDQKKPISKADHVMCFEDSQKTQSLFFTNHNQHLVEISEHGLVRIWDFLSSTLIWSKHFQTQVVDMVYCSIYQLIIVAFRGQLRFFEWGTDKRSLQERQQKMVAFNFLSHLVLSQNQQTLALGIQSNSDKSHIVQVYDLTDKQFKFKLKLTLKSPISYIDFSRLSIDKTLMLVKTAQKSQLYDLSTKNVYEIPIESAKKIEWLDRGLQISEKTQRARVIHREISGQDVVIRKIAEAGASILIADSAGHVFMVSDADLTGKCKLGISSIDFIYLSSCGRWCAVVSKQDRNIVILELFLNN